MASVIKVESFDVDVNLTASQTHTLTNSVGSLTSGFVRRVTSIDKQSGPVGSTGNANANVACGAAFLSDASTVSFRQDSTTSQKIIGEVWRYTGSVGGPDEFIVRGNYTITLAGTTSGSVATSGVVNRNRCIPFWTGATQTAASVNDYDASTVSVYIDASGNIQAERGSATGTLVVYVTVVEFTGTNWSIGHVKSASHDGTNQLDIAMSVDSTGVGAAFNVGDWATASIIEGSLEGDTSETGLSDNLGCWTVGSTASTASFYNDQDTGTKNDGVAYGHILAHPALDVHRGSDINYAEGNGSYTATPWTTGSSTTSAVDEMALEWYSDTSGTGTAHARGRLSSYITSSNTITTWVHRSGNNVRIEYGVVDFSNVDGTGYLVISDADTDNIVTNSQTNVVISGSSFEAVQGTGKVELVQNSDYTGTKVLQSIDSWSDTSIQIDITAGGLLDSNAFLFITTDGGGFGFIALTVGIPPETYAEAILNMDLVPDHLWTFQNTYDDEVGTATANASAGTPTFDSGTLLCKGDSHSLLLNSTIDWISPANQTDMNTSSIPRRYIGGWFQVNNVSQTLSVIWEEGAQVNNIAFLNGFGNNAMFQIANASDDYIQLYLDKPLTPNRTYHILLEFNASGFKGGVCSLFLDGVKQSKTNGNPWETTQLDSHSGSISWGHATGESLKVGDDRGTDATTIEFTSPVSCNYSHWHSWSNVTFADDQVSIRQTLFEKGARSEIYITTDTEANMQTALDVYASTLFTDASCAIDVGECIDGSFTLDLNSITFEDRVSIQIRYLGSSTLTLVKKGTTELDETKLAKPYGGAFLIENPATLTIEGVIDTAEVRVYDDNLGTNNYGTELTGTESNSGTSFSYSHNGSVNSIIIQMMIDGYEETIVPATLGSADQTLTLSPKVDLNK